MAIRHLLEKFVRQFGLSSTSTVHGYLNKLQQKGAIEKSDKKTRALKVLIGEEKAQSKDFYLKKEMVEVPVVGRVAAGLPILAEENIQDTFPIPIDFVGNSESFMLVVKGESMIEARNIRR